MLAGDARPEAWLKKYKIIENCVLSFSPDPTKHPARVRKCKKTGWKGVTAVRFWRLSLCNLWCLVKTMFARNTSKGAGSEARGEGRERDYFD